MVCFSIALNNSYITMAIAPTTTRPAKARPICMAEPALIDPIKAGKLMVVGARYDLDDGKVDFFIE